MDTQRQLEWVSRNRSVKKPVVTAGSLVSRVVRQAREKSYEPAAEVAAILAELVDEEFRLHCLVGAVRRGRLVIHVDQPGLVYSLRLRWASRLCGALIGRWRRWAVDEVLFKFSLAGVQIPAAVGRAT